MKRHILFISIAGLFFLTTCTTEDQQRTEEIFKPETEKLNRISDSAQVRIDKYSDSAKRRLDKIADSAEANLRRIADSGKVRLNKLKDSLIDSEVDKNSDRLKEAIRGKKISGSTN